VHPPPRGRRPPTAQVNRWAVLGFLPDPVVVLRRDGTFLHATGSAAKFLGAHPAEGSRLRDMPAARTAALLGGLLDPGRPAGEHAGPWQVPGPDGKDAWLLAIATALPGEDAVVVTLRDVTLQHQARRQADSETRRLRDLAFCDERTGLPNLRYFKLRAAEATAAGPYALVFLDLNGFKPVNDQYGHEAGDEVLEITGKRMARAVRPDVTVARVGGDEFAAVVPALQDPRAQGSAVAQRIHGLFEEPFHIKAGTVSVGASVGTAVAGDAPTLGGVMQCADAAMYHAKENKLGPTPWTPGIPLRRAVQRHQAPSPGPDEDLEI
jgi:diguanylate cyclase (GGDEF)-like protein